MSMYRQLLSVIILTSLLALMGSLFASTLSTRAYLVEQLRVKNQDNASALALSLSQTVDDLVQVDLVISAQFDSGNYRLVRLGCA
jgi:LapD/MoxY periplasmic domain